MFPLLRPVAIALLFASVFMPAGVQAQDALPTPTLKAKPTKSKGTTTAAANSKERRPGELEGWESGVTAPLKKKNANRPADALSEKALPDGGLPLPDRPSTGQPLAPAGFDKNGNLGGAFRF